MEGPNGPYVLCTARHRQLQNQLGRITRRPIDMVHPNWRRCRRYRGGGPTLGTRAWRIPEGLRRRRDDEHGAEMVEFAFVVVLLIALLYGIITYGLILAAQATVTQAAADGSPGGHRRLDAGRHRRGPGVHDSADEQAGSDLGWMNKGCTCSPDPAHAITCLCVPDGLPVERQQPVPEGDGDVQLQLVTRSSPRCPGLGVITPSTHLVDQRPPDLDPELVGAGHVEDPEDPSGGGAARRAGRDPHPDRRSAWCCCSGAGAMGVDIGFTVDGSRQAQAMADTAALDMARYINIADCASTQRRDPVVPERQAGQRRHRQRRPTRRSPRRRACG